MRRIFLVLLFLSGLPVLPAQSAENTDIYARDNLMAWCIVPFDDRPRGPEARAEMLARMGITMLAYDWRAEHIPTFDEEIQTLKRWGITLQSFWFPGGLNAEAQAILDALKRNEVTTELWITMNGGAIACTPEEQAQRVADHAQVIRPIAEAAAAQGCTVGLYNHGAWFGEPANQIAIIEALKAEGITNVGMVYNQHHGHHHVENFAPLLQSMLPYLYAINLNGMEPDGDTTGKKIWPLGKGSLDKELLKIIRDSGYTGPIGILNHTMMDAEAVLRDNLEGLEWIVPQLDGAAPKGPRPDYLPEKQEAALGAESSDAASGLALQGALVEEGDPAFRTPPITVSLRAQLRSAAGYNILVASDTKASGAHWEIFTEAGSGRLAVYTPGRTPDHVRSETVLTDNQWHHVAMHYGTDRIALFVDGELAAEAPGKVTGRAAVPGGLAIGRLVEGQFFCDGLIDDVVIQAGIHPVDTSGSAKEQIIRQWHFDELPAALAPGAPPEVENPLRRAALPEFQVIPAAAPDTLSPALAQPDQRGWHRSHGNHANTRFAATTQIHRGNVKQLTQAWIYHSGDGAENVQCNPICVDEKIIAPTSGGHVVALNGTTGEELWRFKPEGRPAHRGLVYWPGDEEEEGRVIFPAGNFVYALHAETGTLAKTFGGEGRIAPGPSVVAPAIYQDILIIPGLLRDVWAFDIRTGTPHWTFNTIPDDNEYGRDTWDGPEEGANCWGGMALDEARGIAYIATGSPKPNFTGASHHGQNLFSNCVIALNAETGERLWHFQEIRHDIWDLDIPAPPNLVTLDWHGKPVDAVAQVTKLGNTLLLDRVSGEPLFPFRLRRAPTSPLPGERTWPYQPDPEWPEPFSPAGFTADGVTDRNREAHARVLASLERANTGWFAPFTEDQPTALLGIHGGAEWTGAAFDPNTGRLYVSANNIPWMVTVFQPDPVVHGPGDAPTPGRLAYEARCIKCHGTDRFGVGMAPPLHGLAKRLSEDDVRALLHAGRNAMPAAEGLEGEELDVLLDYLFLRDGSIAPACEKSGPRRYTHNGYPKLLDHEGYPGSKPPWGTLNCLDLSSGKLIWQVPLGVYPDLAQWGEDDTGAENFGGATVTAGGLVFCAGTPDNTLRAFDADTGAVLWEGALPYGGYAPPTVYEAEGKTYIALAATGGGKLGTEKGDTWVAFALP